MALHQYGTSWFLAQLKPNCARIAVRNLDRQGFKTFLPLGEETRKRNGKFVTTLRPLFPGYLFVAFDAARGLWRSVNSTYGVTRLVSFGAEPAVVPAELVSQLMQRCDSRGKFHAPKPWKTGDRVMVIKGPLADFVGEVESIAPNRRVWVLMEIMGAHARVAVGAGQLRAM
jgi:transcriptional antiterminator RfaH